MSLPINYRRDLAGKVYQLTQYSPLQPIADKNYDIVKLNERLIKINHAVRVCFDAIADLATRDSSFLPSFFQGFVNPVYVKSRTYEDLTNHLFINGFNSNGTPMSFSESRVVYSYADLGDITNEDYDFVLYKNGEMMQRDDFDVSNTAYGVKAYVKQDKLINNDNVTMAVYRIFNAKYQMYKDTIQAPQTGYNAIVDVNISFPSFYSVEYLQVAVRHVNQPHYEVLDPATCSITFDSANRKLRVFVRGVQLAKFDTVIVYDTTSYFRTRIFGSNHDGARSSIHPVALIQKTDSGENVPVAFSNYRDFDIWLNGRHLIPGKHFVVTPGHQLGLDDKINYIEFLIQQPSESSYWVEIMKNVPYKDNNTTYLSKDKLDVRGVEFVNTNLFPIMKNMGECFINGRFVNPAKLSTVHRQVLVVDNVDDTTDFFYKFNPPINDATNAMIEEAVLASTDFDKFVNLTGGINNLISVTKNQRDPFPVKAYPDVVESYNGFVIPIVTNYLRWALAAVPDIGNFVLDQNDALATSLWDLSFWDQQYVKDAIIDCNRLLSLDINIDCNYGDFRGADSRAALISKHAPIISNFGAYALETAADTLSDFTVDSNIPVIPELWNLTGWNEPNIHDVNLDANLQLNDPVEMSGSV